MASLFCNRGKKKTKVSKYRPRNDEQKEQKYDVNDLLKLIKKDVDELMKKYKTGKGNINEDMSTCLENKLHSHIRMLNEVLGTPLQEVSKLESDLLKNKTKYEQMIKELEIQINSSQDEIKRLTSANNILEQRLKNENENIKTLTLLQKDKKALDEKVEQYVTEISQLKDQLQCEKAHMITDFGSQIQSKDEEIQSLKDQLQREAQLITDHYGSQIQSKDEEILRLHENLKQLQKEKDAYVKKNDSESKSLQIDIQQKENTIKQLVRQRDEERTAKEEERRQKDEALTRLSAVAGDRLRNNNPGITDLSDPNRPMKIAEKFTEMYDNDWTDAMEALEELQIEEDQCVEILLHFLTDAYEECERIVSVLDSHLVKAVTVTVFENGCKETGTSDQSKQSLPAELTKPIRDLRKTSAANCVEELQKELPQLLQEKRHLTDEHMKACEHFIADCIKYAWMMQVQDPPVYIEWKFPQGSKIDTNILRSYTKAGDHVDFVVWPVLYLHKGGPVLNKGVVQPRQS